MKKIPSVFVRDRDGDKLYTEQVTPGCEWVLAGEGIATLKWDGTACMVRDGVLYKRYDRRGKGGKTKPEPLGWIACDEAPDPMTGHWPGWMPVGPGPEDRWHRAAFERYSMLFGRTYELVGPKVNGNPHRLERHCLWMHGDYCLREEIGRSRSGVLSLVSGARDWMRHADAEGIVFHHPDGRMAKATRRGFGMEWPVRGGA